MKVKNIFFYFVLLATLLCISGCYYFEYQTKSPEEASISQSLPKQPKFSPPSENYYYEDQKNKKANVWVERPPYITRYYKTRTFNDIEIVGDVSVVLQKGDRKVKVKEPNIYPLQANISLENKVLRIDATNNKFGKSIVVTVSTPCLNGIHVSGNADVYGNSFPNREFRIDASGNSVITLRGEINLRKVAQDGDTRIDISWVNSKKLNVISNGNGYLYLGGKVKYLATKQNGNSFIDLRYLRAEEITALSAGNAEAHIFATEKLSAFAREKSTIYYHNPQLKHTTTFSEEEGNVLQGDILQ